MKIKFCGFTRQEDIDTAVKLGVDALGFIFYKKSPRYIEPEKAAAIIAALPPFVQSVGVFVNHSAAEIQRITDSCQLDIVQLHGDESPDFCENLSSKVIKAFRVSTEADLDPIADYKGKVSAILLDTKSSKGYGGTGEVFDWRLAIKAKKLGIPLILSGGLNAQNIKNAVNDVAPYALDLSSGIEKSPGIKDESLMASLLSILDT